ncbi:beta family protein [Undibacterium aquatile]|uniref:Beta family protein n=1 Tax=Undibacterium aquatile TaxID=1537398 RepID=A0ABR6XBY8_9BURK|nr:beta family protein [Undibacterium aquatile]MBC3810085.1 beta family protein [Undibacterium aquatile]
MSLLYVPVMGAKKGEFDALSNLQTSISEKAMPIFELPAQKTDTTIYEKSINRTAGNAGKAWSGRSAFLDISKWSPNARTESGIHVLEYAFSQFVSNGILVNPVVGYDRWDDPVYSQAIKNIRAMHRITPCIRLDREAIQDDMLDVEYFSERLSDIMAALEVSPINCYVLVDFGNVSTIPVPDLIENAENAINVLRGLGFKVVIVAGGSMPTAVNEAVDTPDAVGCIPRIEMLAWKAIFSKGKDRNVIFGDYLIRNPDAADGVIAPNANAKIRYTIENQFFIVRGHSKKLDSLTIQHKELSSKLARSAHYMGPSFSWGDSEVLSCSTGVKEIRDATTMIAVDTNHHINAVISEVFEHQRTTVHSMAKSSAN